MLFNSFDFAVFLPVVFLFYWLARSQNIQLQNFIILAASYLFYGWWDPRFLALIIFSTLLDFSIGILINKQERERSRKILLWASVALNLGVLGFFKYYNFFVDSFVEAFSLFGSEISAGSLNIILPVGISFYTFQTMSYTIDIYRNKITPTSNILSFAAFVAFFPQLVAGPIERASHLLPQFLKQRVFDYSKAVDGLRQMLWGLFKKIVIADACAEQVNLVFEHPEAFNGSSLVLGLVYFSVQIYCDFSGYSDIAIGTSRLFGFDLKRNFAFPYFSRNVAEFWRRWHISLSTWFRDYLYIPLGGSRGSSLKVSRNIFIIFIVSGFWHGANWTFVIWGALHALFIIPVLLFKKDSRQNEIIASNSFFPKISEFTKMVFTFGVITLAWVFFRSKSLTEAFYFYELIFNESLFQSVSATLLSTIYLLPIVFIVEWFARKNQYGLERIAHKAPTLIRWSIYAILIVSICLNAGREQEFIYFQF